MRIILVAFACLFLAEEVLSGSSTFEDIRVFTQNDGLLNCDSMICPKGTAKCRVTKRNDPNNFEIILRHRRCFNENEKILKEEKIKEPNKSHGTVNVNVTGGSSGRPMTPKEQKELNDYLRKTQEQVQSELGPFFDGSFERNLQNQISQTLQNAHRF